MMFLASAYSRSENVGIEPIVVAELKFRDVQRHIFGRHFVERANYAALEDAPKAFNRVRVDRADDVLLAGMIDSLMIIFGQSAIDLAFVSGEQANLVGNHFTNERFGCLFRDVLQNAGDHVALAADSANDRSFGRKPMLAGQTVFLIPMFVFVFSADEGLVNLDNAAKLFDVLDQCCSDLVAHEPRGFIGTEPHVAHDLQSAHTLFAGEHEVSDLEPVAERLVGILEDRSGDMGESIAVRGALFTLPMPLARFQVIDLRIAASRAMHAIGPASGNQIGPASIFIWEGRFELSGGHLRNGLRTFCHGSTPLIEPYSHNSGLLSSPGYSPL
jgi:hypothetical protein